MMRCPECEVDGQTSRVYDRGQTRTLLGGGGPYWDENDVRHDHDPNTISQGYECSNKHFWVVKGKRPCPAPGCSYGQPDLT